LAAVSRSIDLKVEKAFLNSLEGFALGYWRTFRNTVMARKTLACFIVIIYAASREASWHISKGLASHAEYSKCATRGTFRDF
jgi:hypothetical protein